MAVAALEGLAVAWVSALAAGLVTFTWTDSLAASLVAVAIAGKAGGAAALAWRARGWTSARLAADIERRQPAFCPVLTAAVALLEAPAEQAVPSRERVLADAGTLARRASVGDLFPYQRAIAWLGAAGAAWLLVGGYFLVSGRV